MKIFRSNLRSVFLPLSIAACCFHIGSLHAKADNPATTAPSTQPAHGSVDLGDYCTLLLAPKLQDKLQFTNDQRDEAAKLKTRLQEALDVAVGGITVNTQEAADGMQVIFMKKTEKGLDPASSYTSDWFGFTDDGQRTKLAGDGSIVIGIAGRQGMNMGALGLVTLPAGN